MEIINFGFLRSRTLKTWKFWLGSQIYFGVYRVLYIPLSKKSTVNSLKRLLMSLSVGMWWTKALTLKLLLFDLSISFFRHSSRFSVGEMIFFLGLGFCKHVCGAWYFIFVSTVFPILDKMYFVHARGHILFTFKNENILVNILANSIVNQYISI